MLDTWPFRPKKKKKKKKNIWASETKLWWVRDTFLEEKIISSFHGKSVRDTSL